MKKLIFALLFASIFYMGNAQTQNPEDNQVTQVIDKVYDRTTEAVTQLAEALKVPAEHVYSVLVRQQIVEGISLLFGFIIALIISTIATIMLRNAYKNGDHVWNDIFMDYTGTSICVIIGWLATVALLIGFIAAGIGDLINPEYGAIKDIISIL